jgi:hypothetical protein
VLAELVRARLPPVVGDDRLRSAPASYVAVVDQGVLIGLDLKPSRWDLIEHTDAHQKVRDHLGPDLFCSHAEPERRTVAL